MIEMFNSRYLLNKVVLCFLISLFCMFYAFSNLSLADDEGQVLNGNNTEESVGTDNNQNVNYEDDDIANIGLSINQLKELIAALEQKGDALNEEEKARIKDYKNIIVTLSTIHQLNDKYIVAQKFLNSDDFEVNQEQIKYSNELKELVNSYNKTQSLEYLNEQQTELKVKLEQYTVYLKNAKDSLNELIKNTQKSHDNIKLSSEKLQDNASKLAIQNSNILRDTERLDIQADNALLQLKIKLAQFVLSNNGVLYEKLNNNVIIYQEIVSTLSEGISSLDEILIDIRKEKTIKEQLLIQDEKEYALYKTFPLLSKLSKENEELAKQLNEIYDETKNYKALNTEIENHIELSTEIENDIKHQIVYLKDTVFLSQILFRSTKLIPDFEMPSNIADKTSELRVLQYDYRTELNEISNYPKYKEKMVVALTEGVINNNEPKLKAPNENISEAIDALDILLRNRLQLYSKLYNELSLELNQIITLQSNYSRYMIIRDSISSVIYNQMFWSPSNNAINFKWFASLYDNVVHQINNIKQDLSKFSLNYSYSLSFLCKIFLMMFGLFIIVKINKVINKKLSQIHADVKRISKDRYWNTPLALLLLAVKSSYFSILVFLIGVIAISTVSYPSDHVIEERTKNVLMSMLMDVTLLTFLSSLILRIVRKGGVGEIHFRLPYNEKQVKYLRRIFWCYGFLIAIITLKLEALESFAVDVIGQIITISLCSWLLVEQLLVLKRQIKNEASFYFKSISLLYLLFVLAQIVLIATGYFYSAIRLISTLIISYYAVMVIYFLQNVLYRFLSIAANRINFKRRIAQYKQKQQALKEQLENGGQEEVKDATEEFIESLDEPMSIEDINDQTTNVVKHLFLIIYAVVLYSIWSEIFEFASFFQYVTLYTTTSTDGTLKHVSLMDLIVIVYAIVLSVIVCKNFPGVLEVCLFNTVTKLKQYSYSIVTIITYVIVSLCILFTCSRLGLEWEQLQWLVAALSVGLGFGLQEIFGNFISGIIVLFERPIRIGDIITLNGHSGVVSRIRIRSTTITDFEKKEYVVPNKSIITSPLVNWSLNDQITRLTIIASVAYGTKIEKVKEILYKICKDNPYVLEDPSPQVYFTEFGASTLNFEIRVYIAKTKDRNPAKDSINTEIYRVFEENGIEIAFNQLDVYIKNTKNDQEILVKSMDSKEIRESIKVDTIDKKSK